VDLLDEAFAKKKLDVERMKAVPLFNELTFEARILAVIRKHEKR
jgi:hypothetical protein